MTEGWKLVGSIENPPQRQQIERFSIPGLGAAELVFVDGLYIEGLSSMGELPEGVIVTNLLSISGRKDGLVEGNLAKYVDISRDGFSALNTAYMLDGLFVFVPKGVVLEKPVRALFLSTSDGEPTAVHPRNLIIAGESSEVTIIEDYASLTDGKHFTNAVTELVAAENSTVKHYMIERENTEAFNVSTLRIQQARSSNVSSHSALLGGALVRHNVHPVLSGEGANCMINGLYLASGTQHMDNFMRVEHASPHCDSRQFFYGILDDHAKAVFSGRIIVHKDAQKTDAKQTNRNLLLSENAVLDSKPQLEIYADDVKCTHGATIGQLDSDQLFYLRSRSIPEDKARSILLQAFARESINKMENEPVRLFLDGLASEWFSKREG